MKNINDFLKGVSIVVFILFFAVCNYIQLVKFNIAYEQPKAIEKIVEIDPVVVISTRIISRDGNLPLDTAAKYATWIKRYSDMHGLDPILVLSIMRVESQFNHTAVSPTGPIGLLQIAFRWHKDKVSSKSALYDPKTNIHVGAKIIKEYSLRTSSEYDTLKMYYGGSKIASRKYANKVLIQKYKYQTEIMSLRKEMNA